MSVETVESFLLRVPRCIKIPDYRLEAELRHYNPGLNCRLCTLIPNEIHN